MEPKPTTPSQATPTLGNRLAYLSLIGIESILRLIPLSIVWRTGATLGTLAYPIAGKRKHIVLRNLGIAHPDQSAEEHQTRAKDVFRHTFANLLSSAKTGTMSVERLAEHITIEGQDIIDQLPEDKGAIFMLLHMGNWEVLTRAPALLGLNKPAGAMFQPLNNPLIDQHVLTAREKEGTQLFAKRKGLAEAAKFVKNGGALGILSDQFAGRKGIRAKLFGKETSISPLAASMAQKYQCPIIPVALTTLRPGHWKLALMPAISIPAAATKQEAVVATAQSLETIMRTHSKDIFWLHNRWKKRAGKNKHATPPASQ